MREFNTSGPCDPALHYTVMREALIAEGREKIKKGRYFTLFAPRQAGKTTFFRLLLDSIKEAFTPVRLTFENLQTASREEFYRELNHKLRREFKKQTLEPDVTVRNAITLQHFFEKTLSKPAILVIDEFEGIPDCVLNEVMHTFRTIYHEREDHCLHALILVGVSTVAELVVSQASPFNITEELRIPYFTREEVDALIDQYVTESGQVFEPDVIKAIYDNTRGQPGLVCAVCEYLVKEQVPDRRQPVTMAHWYRTQQHFLTERFDKNIVNIVQKAREKKDFMLKLVFGNEPVPFSIHDPRIAWLYANGVLDRDNGNTDIGVPLYKKVLITAFRPLLNGETGQYLTSHTETVVQYLTADGNLNVDALLDAYRAYVRRRGFRAFDTEHLKEAAWHYSLDGFIHFFIECLEGQTFIEVPSGRGRTDILIVYKNRKYIVETKRFVNRYYFDQGKGQLAEYLKSENLTEGWYAVFSNLHTDQDELFTEETVAGKRIFTHIIPTAFEQPSRLPVPEALKLTEAEKIALNLLKPGKLSLEDIAQATGVSAQRVEQLSAVFRPR